MEEPKENFVLEEEKRKEINQISTSVINKINIKTYAYSLLRHKTRGSYSPSSAGFRSIIWVGNQGVGRGMEHFFITRRRNILGSRGNRRQTAKWEKTEKNPQRGFFSLPEAHPNMNLKHYKIQETLDIYRGADERLCAPSTGNKWTVQFTVRDIKYYATIGINGHLKERKADWENQPYATKNT